jgi:hypothetical protein
MKKIITMLLVGLMVLSSFSFVFAEEANTSVVENSLEEAQILKKLNLMKEFTEEIHQINALRVEKNQLQIQVVEKKDKLVDLRMTAMEIGDKEALTEVKEKRKEVQVINDEIRALHQQVTTTKTTFKEAVKNDDIETATLEMGKLINIHTSINAKIKEKTLLLDMIIDILS